MTDSTQKTWAVALPSGQVNTYELEQDARDVAGLIRDTDSPECKLHHFTGGRWVVADAPEGQQGGRLATAMTSENPDFGKAVSRAVCDPGAILSRKVLVAEDWDGTPTYEPVTASQVRAVLAAVRPYLADECGHDRACP